ncbi:MAG TPA: hypothetical protein VHY20_15190 [Pirellulales bacterium]|jgi:hypothetical protein|nr:hypothetical protein [Pirellulales bacterium]
MRTKRRAYFDCDLTRPVNVQTLQTMLKIAQRKQESVAPLESEIRVRAYGTGDAAGRPDSDEDRIAFDNLSRAA